MGVFPENRGSSNQANCRATACLERSRIPCSSRSATPRGWRRSEEFVTHKGCRYTQSDNALAGRGIPNSTAGKGRWRPVCAAMAACALLVLALPQATAGNVTASSFTYQGQLKQTGRPVTDVCDFEFSVWTGDNDPDPGSQVGGTIPLTAAVDNGLFEVVLDFGPGVFIGPARWLNVEVACPSGGALQPLSPRQVITGAPYAMTAHAVVGVDGHSLDAADGSPVDAVRVDDSGRTRLEKGGLLVFDQAGQGITLTSDTIKFNEGLSEDPVYSYGAASDTHVFYADGGKAFSLAPGNTATLYRGGVFEFRNSSNATSFNLFGDQNSGGGGADLLNSAGATTIALRGRDEVGTGGCIQMFNNGEGLTIDLDSDNGGRGLLNVLDGAGATALRLQGSASGGEIRVYDTAGTQSFYIDGDQSGGAYMELENASGLDAIELRGEGNASGGEIEVFNRNGNRTFELWGDKGVDGSAPTLRLFNVTGTTATVELDGQESGGGLVRASSPTNSGEVVMVGSGSGGGGELRARAVDGTISARLYGEGNGSGGQLLLTNDGGTNTIDLRGDDGFDDNSSTITLSNSNTVTVELDGLESAGGAVRVNSYNTNGSAVLLGDGVNAAGELSLRNSLGTRTVSIYGDETDAGGAYFYYQDGTTPGIELDVEGWSGEAAIQLYNQDGIDTVRIVADESGDGGDIRLTNSEGVETCQLDGNYSGTGESRMRVDVVEILGGADLSEQFDIRPATILDDGPDVRRSLAAEPGMVVSIDPEHIGELVVSTHAYDKTVAGIVSGAGGVKPGLLMGQRDTDANGKHAVALTGRVWVNATTSNGEIQPGDLLTTSDVAGHAMRVSDHEAAQGAILGKAMSRLEQGDGLVLVLVSLQ